MIKRIKLYFWRHNFDALMDKPRWNEQDDETAGRLVRYYVREFGYGK